MPVAPRILRSIQLSLHWAGRAGLLFWRAGLLFWRAGLLFWRAGLLFWRAGLLLKRLLGQ
jgi:hypothetical protein